jgi:hypothetical protein
MIFSNGLDARGRFNYDRGTNLSENYNTEWHAGAEVLTNSEWNIQWVSINNQTTTTYINMQTS